jgi:hypothetical protein
VNGSRVSLTNGFPTHFLSLKKLIDTKDRVKIRGVLTLLTLTRAVLPNKAEEKLIKPSFHTINAPYTGKEYTIPLSFIRNFVKSNKLNITKPEYTKSIHYFSSKGSPFGKATISGPYALFCMMQIWVPLLMSFKKLMGEGPYDSIFGNFSKLL